MTETILVAGTASHVGKSTVATGLCRLLADRGYAVAPFKAQNMSNNARAVLTGPSVRDRAAAPRDRCNDDSAAKRTTTVDQAPTADQAPTTERTPTTDPAPTADQAPTTNSSPTADEASTPWGEIGVSQFVQARAARTTPTTDSNPVLLKPRGDGESQLIVDGRAVGHVESGAYYETHWEAARTAAVAAHRRLRESADVIVAEGAGSIAEINLHDRDLANVETARFADARIVLCVDIERGGAFASLYGTLALLPDDVRDRVVGAIITKFRGDPSLLEPGIRTIEDRCDVPVLGVVPYADFDLPEEDSLGIPDGTTTERRGADDGVPAEHSVTVGVPRLDRLSNAADVEALATVPGVRVAYLPVTETGRDRLATVDAVVIPGTKNTVDDLRELRRAGFDDGIRAFEGPVVGICGGYQLLGRRLLDAHHEGTGSRSTVDGFDLLPIETRFSTDKRVRRRRVSVDGAGPIAGATGTATGYEIHAGESTALEPVAEPLEAGSAVRDSVLGTYLHGLFENEDLRNAFVDAVYDAAGTDRPDADRVAGEPPADPFDHVASVIEESVTLDPIVETVSGPADGVDGGS